MKRRTFTIGWALAGAWSFLAGCDSLNHQLRSKSDDSKSDDDSEESKDGDTNGSGKGFFKATRLSGAMSDEGREVERNLGIH